MFETLFGADMPLAARLVIAALILIIVLAALLFAMVRIRTTVRRLIIRISEVLALIIIFGSTLIAGFMSASWAYAQSRILGQSPEFSTFLGFVLGALSGFITSAVLFGFLFILIEIAENTRRTVSFFERMSVRGQS